MKKEMYPVDKDKLLKQLEKRNLTAKEVSLELGYNKFFISNCVNRGQINIPGAKSLEKFFNIKPEDYAPDPEVETIEAVEEVREIEITIDYDRLEKAIYAAVYQAIKKVELDHLREG